MKLLLQDQQALKGGDGALGHHLHAHWRVAVLHLAVDVAHGLEKK